MSAVIHHPIGQLPPEARADWFVSCTEAGRFLRSEPGVRLFTEDAALDQLLPFLATPDVITGEPALIEVWQSQRPAAHAAAEKACSALQPLYGETKELKARVLIRMAACRKLDAATTGSEVFSQHPAFGGQASCREITGDDSMAIKVGSVTQAVYASSPNSPTVPAVLHSLPTILQVERVLFPLLGENETVNAKYWDPMWQKWLSVGPLREHEHTSQLPLAMHHANPPLMFTPGHPPEGYIERLPLVDLTAQGDSVEALARLGLSVHMPAVVAEYFAKRPPAPIDAAKAAKARLSKILA